MMSWFSSVAVVINVCRSRMNSFRGFGLTSPLSKYSDICCAWSVSSHAGVSWGTLYAVSTSISELSFSSNTNPHHYPYLSSILCLTRLMSDPIIPIIFSPGLVYPVIGAIDDNITTLQYSPSL